MRRLLRIISSIAGILVAVGVLTLPARAQTCGMGVTCTLDDLGDGQYKFTFVIKNTSPNATTLFKWRLEDPSISPAWTSVSFDTPTGWDGVDHVGRIDFETPNASGNTDRIYSATALPCGGANERSFSWTFNRNAGPVPSCAMVVADNFTFHTQVINASTCANVGGSFVCPLVIPTLPSTWSTIKTRFSN